MAVSLGCGDSLVPEDFLQQAGIVSAGASPASLAPASRQRSDILERKSAPQPALSHNRDRAEGLVEAKIRE